jgi:ribosomal protein L36
MKDILLKENPSLEELLWCCEQVRRNGDVMVIKLDGAREKDWYTVFISFPIETGKEMIRADKHDLKTALVNTLSRYCGL